MTDAKYPAFAQRVRDTADHQGLTPARLAERLKLTSGTFSRYWNGIRLPPSDTLIDLAEALNVAPSWLIRGSTAHFDHTVRSADDADWIELREFDLRELSDGGKGAPIGSIRFRRDWLNRTFGTDKGLWITALPTDYPPIGLLEGDQVICRDISINELNDRNLCVWRQQETNRLIVGRFSWLQKESVRLDADGENWITPIATRPRGDIIPEIHPIGRILGRPLSPIR